MSTTEQSGQPRRCPACDAEATDPSFRFCVSCGARLDAEPGGALVPLDVDADDDGAGAGWWRRHRRWVILAAAVVLVVPIGFFFTWQWTGLRTATGPVEGFFAALADGDGPAAAALLEHASISNGDSSTGSTWGAEREDALDSPIWAPGALASGYTAPTDVKLEADFGAAAELDRRPEKDSAMVTASFTVAGGRFELDFWVERIGGDWSRDWQIGAVMLDELQPAGSSTPSRIAAAEPAVSMVVPPGEYEVRVEGSVLFEDAVGRAVVGGEVLKARTHQYFDTDITVELDLALRDDVQPEVESQLRDLIDGCAEPYQMDWEACPYEYESNSSIVHYVREALGSRSEWVVESYPEVEVYVEGRVACVRVVEPGLAVGNLLDPADGSLAPYVPGSDFEAALNPAGILTVRDGRITFLDQQYGC